jgi:plasmid stability protein
MTGLHMRDISEEILRYLRRRAQEHYRSVQRKIRFILEEAACSAAPPENALSPIQLRQVEVGGDRSWTREDFY